MELNFLDNFSFSSSDEDNKSTIGKTIYISQLLPFFQDNDIDKSL